MSIISLVGIIVTVPVNGKPTQIDITNEMRQACESILPPLLVTFGMSIVIQNVPRLIPGWTDPIVVGRHAFGDQYRATDFRFPGAGKLTMKFVGEDGEVIEKEVFNAPGANANAVMELVLCGLIMAARNIPAALEWVKTLDGDVSKEVEAGKSRFAGTEITGKTLGVIGLGAIGEEASGLDNHTQAIVETV